MNTINPYLQQYKKNQVETATPEQVLILLYDGAIQYLNKAKFAIEDNNKELAHNNLLSCQKIIIEFMDTLDMDAGGDLAKNLYRLYNYLYKTLVQANFDKDADKIDEVLGHLKSLRETWQKAISISNSEKSADLIEDRSDKYESFDYKEGEDDEDEDYDEIDDEDEE